MIGRIEPGQTANPRPPPPGDGLAQRASPTPCASTSTPASPTPGPRRSGTTVRFDVVWPDPRPSLTYDYWLVDDPALAGQASGAPHGRRPSTLARRALCRPRQRRRQPPAGRARSLLAIEVRQRRPRPGRRRPRPPSQPLRRPGPARGGLRPSSGRSPSAASARGSLGLSVSPSADPALPVSPSTWWSPTSQLHRERPPQVRARDSPAEHELRPGVHEAAGRRRACSRL
jgi:hypothetical protein